MLVQNKVTIEFGGKERTFWLGLGFLAMLFKSSGLTLENLSSQIKENPFKTIPDMMFQSLKYGYDRVGLEIDFNVFILTEWIDEAGGVGSEPVKLFLEGFGQAMQSATKETENKNSSAKGVAKKKKVSRLT